MVNQCAVFGCNNNSRDIKKQAPEKSLKFFRFPIRNGTSTINIEKSKEEQELSRIRVERWFNFLRRNDLKIEDLKTRRICSDHFVTGAPAEIDDTSHIDWVPSIRSSNKKSKNIIEVQRFSRWQSRSEKNKEAVIDMNSVLDIHHPIVEHSHQSCEIQTDVTLMNVEEEIDVGKLLEQLRAVKRELRIKSDSLQLLRKKNDQFILNRSSFVKKNAKLKFYTGLPCMEMVDLILSTVNQGLYQIKAQNLNNFQKLLITLMKLRLNLTYQDIAYRFDVSDRTVSDVFQKVVIILKNELQPLIHWPDRDCLKLSMPRCFISNFGYSVVSIIDCFEISTERPSVMRSRNQSWSDYKQEYTAKYLIGITPYGAISFISEGFGGHTTDPDITVKSRYLDNITAGDVVLADRGFPKKGVKELFANKGATLLTPAFKNQKDQLHAKEVEESRRVAAVRIHIERVIGCVRKKYTILNGPVPIELLKTSFENFTLLDYSVHVACMLTNLCDSIVTDKK